MTDLFQSRRVMVAVLAILALLIWFALSRRDRSHASRINFDDLLLGEDGTISRAAVVMMGSFALMSWGMVYMWLTGKMTEGYFNGFGLIWVAPAVTKLIVNKPPVATQTTQITQTTVATEPAHEPTA